MNRRIKIQRAILIFWLATLAAVVYRVCMEQFILKDINQNLFAVSPDDLNYGKAQLLQMLNDRPEMKKFVAYDDAVGLWTQRQFAGAGIGKRIVWDNAEPQQNDSRLEVAGDFKYLAGDKQQSSIQLTSSLFKGRFRGERLWAQAVFELLLLRDGATIEKLRQDALNGTLKRREWIDKCTRLEFAAWKKTAEFYQSIWLRNAQWKSIGTIPDFWQCNAPDLYERWMASPDGAYASHYWDSMFPPFLQQEEKSKAEREEWLMRQMQMRTRHEKMQASPRN